MVVGSRNTEVELVFWRSLDIIEKVILHRMWSEKNSRKRRSPKRATLDACLV